MLKYFIALAIALDVPTPAASQAAVSPPPMAVFDSKYRAQHRGKTRVSVPEVYELVNVAIALTTLANESETLVAKDNPYYAGLQTHFAPVRDHPFVAMLDREIRGKYDRYFDVKKNAYAFEYGVF